LIHHGKLVKWSEQKNEKEEKMGFQTIQYTSPLDALIAIAKRLSLLERRHDMSSEEFFDRYVNGRLGDDGVFVEWANDYRHFLAIREEVDCSKEIR
jgi:hypothetical protein